MATLFFCEVLTREEAKDIQAVVQRDDDNALGDEYGIGVARFRGSAGEEAASMDPNHDGELAALFCCRGCVDVQVEAVFGRARVSEDVVVPDIPLLAAIAKVGCVTKAAPCGWLFRGSPAEIADRRCSVWQAEKGLFLAVANPFAHRLSLHSFDLGSGRLRMGKQADEKQAAEQAGANHDVPLNRDHDNVRIRQRQ